MKEYMWKCYLQYCSYCFLKNKEPEASFEDYVYIFFGNGAYREEFNKYYQGQYAR